MYVFKIKVHPSANVSASAVGAVRCVQDDVVMGTLTVRENLTFSAALRLPASIPQKEKEEKVEKLIQELGLGRVANSRGRRGGDRKRETRKVTFMKSKQKVNKTTD